MRSTLYYTGLALDRASGRRTDPDWISAMRASVELRVIPLWRDHCLIRAGQPVVLGSDWIGYPVAGLAPQPGDPAASLVFLGMTGQNPHFAADLSAWEKDDALEICRADDVADIRSMIAAISPAEAGLLAYARGIVHWQRRQQFCGCCGGRCDARDGGHVRACRDCGMLHFPRIEPAIIVLVELPGEPRRCLLGRHQGAGPDRYSTLAGFVEVGESLEDAVRREVAEEAGVAVGPVSYQGSQAWPFPAGLMIGFRAVADSPEVRVDGTELLDARWFTAGQIRARIADKSATPPYRVDSIGRALIEDWLEDGS